MQSQERHAMNARRTYASTGVLTLPGGNEDNDLWFTEYRPEEGGVAMGSTWVPTDEERKAIAAGANIELVVWGVSHPPVAVRLSTYPLGKPPAQQERNHG
jgi:hypothetical protein